MIEDRRRFRRFDTSGIVTLRLEDGTSRSLKGDLVDISFTGISTVVVQERIELGTYVGLELTSESWDESIICKGKIVHTDEIKDNGSKGFRMGIEFVDIDKKAIRRILNIIQENISAQTTRGRTKRSPTIDKQHWL